MVILFSMVCGLSLLVLDGKKVGELENEGENIKLKKCCVLNLKTLDNDLQNESLV